MFILVRKGKQILVKAKVYQNIFLLAKGLRFSPPLKKKEGLLLVSSTENLIAIDMLFVFFPIDVIWLDKQKEVIYVARNVQPFTLSVVPPKKAQYILECQTQSTIKLKVKDKLSFVIHQ